MIFKLSPEDQEQRALFDWCNYHLSKYPELALLHHIPNGGKRDKTTAARLKLTGVKAGVPDLCLPVARGVYHGLYIEMKAGKNTPTQNQRSWIESLTQQGYCVEVCYGWESAKDTIVKYLELSENDIRRARYAESEIFG